MTYRWPLAAGQHLSVWLLHNSDTVTNQVYAEDIWLNSPFPFAWNTTNAKIAKITQFQIISFDSFFPGKYKRGECANNQSANVVSLLFKKVPPWGDIGFQQRIRSRLSVNSIKGGASSIPPIHPPAASNRSNFSILHPSFVLPEGSQREKSLQIRHDLLDVKV